MNENGLACSGHSRPDKLFLWYYKLGFLGSIAVATESCESNFAMVMILPDTVFDALSSVVALMPLLNVFAKLWLSNFYVDIAVISQKCLKWQVYLSYKAEQLTYQYQT